MTRKEVNLKEIYLRRKTLGEQAVKNGLCKICFKRPRRKAQVATELRRFRKRNNGNCSSKLSTKDWNRILNIFGNKCLKCGSAHNIQIDHVIPLSLGGEHSFSNVQPLCAICNNKKQNRVADYRAVFFSDWT